MFYKAVQVWGGIRGGAAGRAAGAWKFERGQIAKLVGVAPMAYDSGTKNGKRKTTAGRSQVRRVLYMAALVSAKHNPVMKQYCNHLSLKGKPKKMAPVAVMRKLLVTLNNMARDRQIWR